MKTRKTGGVYRRIILGLTTLTAIQMARLLEAGIVGITAFLANRASFANRSLFGITALFHVKAMLTITALFAITAWPSVAGAAPVNLNIATAPLDSGVTPPPNVLIVADDSGSMDWEIVVSQDAHNKENSLDGFMRSGNFFGYANLFGYVPPFKTNDIYDNHFEGTSFAGRVAPPLKTVSDQGNSYEFRTQMAGIWRVRNHQYNLTYYNPNVRYDPWPGYANASPTAALVDPSKTATVDLTLNATNASNNNLSVALPSTTINGGVKYVQLAAYLPFYYTWNRASNNDSIVDANECGRLIEIKANAVAKDCLGNSLGGMLFPMAKAPARTDCAASNTCTAAEELKNFANWFSFYRRREFVAKAALSKVVPTLTDVRLGYATLNGDLYASGTRPLHPIANSNDMNAIKQHIFNTVANGGTPLLRTLNEAGKYFACESGHIMGTNACPSQNNASWSCQQNYTVMMTDGFWEADNDLWKTTNTYWSSFDSVVTTAAPFADNDSDSSSPFAGGIFSDNNRSGSATNQWLTLADVAMYYYKTDLDANAPNKVAPTAIEKARIADPTYWNTHSTMHQHMNTFTVGFGIFSDPQNSIGSVDDTGQWTPPAMSASVTWPRLTKAQSDSNKLEDLKHTAFNGRGMFYSATNVDNLVGNLQNIFESIRSGIGTVAAVSFNSQQLESGSVAYTASYDSGKGSGDVVAYGIDSTTGLISTASSNVIWRASDRLARKISAGCDTPADTRTVLSYTRAAGAATGVAFGALPNVLSQPQANWIRGHDNHESANRCAGSTALRDRERPDGLLGDIVHSRPLFVGKPSFRDRDTDAYPTGANSYDTFKRQTDVKTRLDMVVVGANDGLLHVFDAARGDEILAYAPRRLIDGGQGNSRIADLTASGYNHQYYVDLSPAVNDVFIKPNASSSRRWTTVVIGGYRAGGRGYFALDMTDPGAFASETSGAAKVLWEFSDLDDGRLGLTFSPPLMAMTNERYSDAADGHKWRAIFGNGYNSDDGRARLFLLDLEAGYDGWTRDSDYKVIDAGALPASGANKNGLGIPRGIDTDGNGTLDYAYAGDLLGNLYRFDLTSSAGDFTATKIFTAKSATNVAQPITTQPLVVRHPLDPNQYVVVFTTGSWMTQTDSHSTGIQSIYAVSDSPSTTVATAATRASLVRRRIETVAQDGGIYRTLAGAELQWSSAVKGWYLDLDARPAGVLATATNYGSQPVVNPGERAVRNMVMRGGYIFVNTVFPTSAGGCSESAGGATMAFHAVTGLLDKPIFDFNADGSFDITTDKKPIAGLVSRAGLSETAMIGSRLVFQEVSAGGVITPKSILTNTDEQKLKGRLSWRQIN